MSDPGSVLETVHWSECLLVTWLVPDWEVLMAGQWVLMLDESLVNKWRGGQTDLRLVRSTETLTRTQKDSTFPVLSVQQMVKMTGLHFLRLVALWGKRWELGLVVTMETTLIDAVLQSVPLTAVSMDK